MPTAYFQRYHHWQAGFPPKSRIYINKAGRRFMDEDASYAVSGGLMDAQDGPVWAIFDDKARTELPAGYADWDAERVAAEADAGRTVRADTLVELAGLIGVTVPALVATVTRWNSQLPNGVDDDFLRHRTLANKARPPIPTPSRRDRSTRCVCCPPNWSVRTRDSRSIRTPKFSTRSGTSSPACMRPEKREPGSSASAMWVAETPSPTH